MVDLDELRREIVLAVSQYKSAREFLRDRRLRELYEQIKSLPPVERGLLMRDWKNWKKLT